MRCTHLLLPLLSPLLLLLLLLVSVPLPLPLLLRGTEASSRCCRALS
jgi:hypothetical protein